MVPTKCGNEVLTLLVILCWLVLAELLTAHKIDQQWRRRTGRRSTCSAGCKSKRPL
jgi:hypothetical protein